MTERCFTRHVPEGAVVLDAGVSAGHHDELASAHHLEPDDWPARVGEYRLSEHFLFVGRRAS